MNEVTTINSLVTEVVGTLPREINAQVAALSTSCTNYLTYGKVFRVGFALYCGIYNIIQYDSVNSRYIHSAISLIYLIPLINN